ncbi:MAG: hypothetical protein KC478_06450 [Bacteriovoracaceae bacterium]|nr:hypothetical protein [Bacteriovoracaceae bacterium]
MKYLILGLTFLIAIPSIAARKYPSTKRDGAQRTRVLEAFWSPGHMTNPDHHVDQYFKYVVNVIDGSLGSFGRNDGLHYFASLLSKNPQAISGNPRICSSFISHDHRTMFPGQISLILNVPVVNYGPMGPLDIGSHGVSSYGRAVRYFERIYKKNKQYIFTPEQLIANGASGSWNEILLIGTNESQLDDKGEFKKVSSTGAILRCLNWKSTTEHPSIRNDISQEVRSYKIRLPEHEEAAIQCLVGKDRMKKYVGKSLAQINTELREQEELGQRLSVDEKRMLYLSNLSNYSAQEDLAFPIILFKKK